MGSNFCWSSLTHESECGGTCGKCSHCHLSFFFSLTPLSLDPRSCLLDISSLCWRPLSGCPVQRCLFSAFSCLILNGRGGWTVHLFNGGLTSALRTLATGRHSAKMDRMAKVDRNAAPSVRLSPTDIITNHTEVPISAGGDLRTHICLQDLAGG